MQDCRKEEGDEEINLNNEESDDTVNGVYRGIVEPLVQALIQSNGNNSSVVTASKSSSKLFPPEVARHMSCTKLLMSNHSKRIAMETRRIRFDKPPRE
jgi:hypothetical protein